MIDWDDFFMGLIGFGSVDLTLYDSLGIVMAVVLFLSYFGAPFWVWSLFCLLSLYGVGCDSLVVWGCCFSFSIIFMIPFVRRIIVSEWIMKLLTVLKVLPTISPTERDAIESGTVWVDGDLFSGKPDFKKILKEPHATLSEEEQSFLDNEVVALCDLVDEWKVYKDKEFSEEIWGKIKQGRFLGMIIPKEYGGLGFSTLGHSAVIQTLSTRSVALGITVMVPNSLGPAELLMHFGTDEQKLYYLPRLAIGKEIPCFALTESQAGSDAGAMSSEGVLFKDPKTSELMIRLNFKKRYITLAGISTILGLAFKLRDPELLLGGKEEVGITCAIIKSSLEGINVSRAHDPLGVAFVNCPVEGKDVVVPASSIIGGLNNAGKGWKMLMECLSAGRGVSLPSTSTGAVKHVLRVTSAYSMLRKQFGMPIGKFEGISDVVADIAGYAYLLDSARIFTCGAIDQGAKPSVVTAISKYHFTEISRKVLNHGMDILGGGAISLGPKNLIAMGYFAAPISITVEGANILTRTLMIFGQGAIRCHPYVLDEIYGLETKDVSRFDRAFFGHIGHVVRNAARSIVLSVSRGYLSGFPRFNCTWRYYQKLSWASAIFAFLSDMALALLGGSLKRKERLTGVFGDVLSWMYLGTAVLNRFHVTGQKKEERLVLKWSMETVFYNIQLAFERIFQEFHPLFRGPIAFWSRLNAIGFAPSGKLLSELSEYMQTPSSLRSMLIQGSFCSSDSRDPLGMLEKAFEKSSDAVKVEKKVKKAIREKKLIKHSSSLYKDALEMGVITSEEFAFYEEFDRLVCEVVRVDDFSKEPCMNL